MMNSEFGLAKNKNKSNISTEIIKRHFEKAVTASFFLDQVVTPRIVMMVVKNTIVPENCAFGNVTVANKPANGYVTKTITKNFQEPITPSV